MPRRLPSSSGLPEPAEWEAPKAFRCEKEVTQPSCLLPWYHGLDKKELGSSIQSL